MIEAPVPTAMYCLPFNAYEIGGAIITPPVWNFQTTLPVARSRNRLLTIYARRWIFWDPSQKYSGLHFSVFAQAVFTVMLPLKSMIELPVY